MDIRYSMGGRLSNGKILLISRLFSNKKIPNNYQISNLFFLLLFFFIRDDAVIAKDFQFHDFLNKMSQFPALLMMIRRKKN